MTIADDMKANHIPQLHKPEYLKEEEEILEFYKGWASCLNNEFVNDSEAGKKFYDVPQVITCKTHCSYM
jgi:hypothetical protein